MQGAPPRSPLRCSGAMADALTDLTTGDVAGRITATEDVWVLMHVVCPFLLQLLLQDVPLVWFLGLTWEAIEIWLLMVFRSTAGGGGGGGGGDYGIFIGDDTGAESLTNAFAVDMVANSAGIILAKLLLLAVAPLAVIGWMPRFWGSAPPRWPQQRTTRWWPGRRACCPPRELFCCARRHRWRRRWWAHIGFIVAGAPLMVFYSLTVGGAARFPLGVLVAIVWTPALLALHAWVSLRTRWIVCEDRSALCAFYAAAALVPVVVYGSVFITTVPRLPLTAAVVGAIALLLLLDLLLPRCAQTCAHHT